MTAFRAYWTAYGGIRALLLSPYLLLSCVFWALCKPIWYDQSVDLFPWSGLALSILPSMVSFSLGALAIFLAFSNEQFLKLLRQKGSESSFLMKVTAAFFHFIIVQFVALGFALLLIAYPSIPMSGVAFLGFIYALACGVAAAAALMDMAEILNAAGKLDD
jgi:hypothetical protein